MPFRTAVVFTEASYGRNHSAKDDATDAGSSEGEMRSMLQTDAARLEDNSLCN